MNPASEKVEMERDVCIGTYSADCDRDGVIDVTVTVDCKNRLAAVDHIQSFCANG